MAVTLAEWVGMDFDGAARSLLNTDEVLRLPAVQWIGVAGDSVAAQQERWAAYLAWERAARRAFQQIGLSRRIARLLVEAEFDPPAVRVACDCELMDIYGIGPREMRKIRAFLPEKKRY